MLVCPECGFQNTPGTTFCASPTSPKHPGPCGAFLDWAGFDREQVEDPTIVAPGRTGPASTAGRVAVVAVLAPTEVAVDPGAEATIEVRVRNLGSVVDKFVLGIEGPPAGWSVIEPAALPMFPASEGTATVTFRPPRSWQVSAGPARFRLRVSSSAQPGTFTMADGVVAVGAFSSLSGRVVPQTSRHTSGAEHRVMVENAGNQPVSLTFDARDPDEVLHLGIDPTFVTVDPGATATVVLRAGPCVPSAARWPSRGPSPSPSPPTAARRSPSAERSSRNRWPHPPPRLLRRRAVPLRRLPSPGRKLP